MTTGILYVKELVNNQKFEILNKSSDFNTRQIKSTNISRMGLELLGVNTYNECWEVVYWGSKENKYLQSLNTNKAQQVISNVFVLKPPLVILGTKFKESETILELAKKFNITLVKTNQPLMNFQIDTLSYMLEKSAPYEVIHGSLCNIYGIGTLIVGESGVGKSETIVELIKRGHIFVADDTVKVVKHGARLFGVPDEINNDFIEIRGLGILSFSRTFGIEKMIGSTKINIVIELIRPESKKVKFERLGSKDRYYQLLDVNLVHYQIPVTEGRNVAEIIETAITQYKLKRNGFDATKLFIENAKKKNN
ncbi:MAG: HPr(Ser) kinase/phosphatase [Ureaplasma sp.]|nr:HPr(Ser) kinase/phosphatase [Ureaplasma sp.]